MNLQKLPHDFTVCKVKSLSDINSQSEFFFTAKTDEEISLVCITQDTPKVTNSREDGWKAFRIQGTLDFSLVGVLAEISKVLADNNISIFAVSTYNTDYILVKDSDLSKAVTLLSKNGFTFV